MQLEGKKAIVTGAGQGIGKAIAREMARFGVHVNCVCPGPTDTVLFQEQPEKVRMALERAIPSAGLHNRKTSRARLPSSHRPCRTM